MIYTALGLMSGTSCDGIDIAVIKSDGEDYVKAVDGITVIYPQEFRDKLFALMRGKLSNVLEIENELTVRHAEAVKFFTSKYHINLIGFHGQTIKHAPAQGLTWQIGNLPLLTQLTGIDCVGDLRRRDVAAGGQGAPLVPIYLKALTATLAKPAMFLNLGGVANVCYLQKDHMIAFDCGPGNALIDDLCHRFYGIPYDQDGKRSRQGTIDQAVVDKLLNIDFFHKQPPKSLDRNNFDHSFFSHLAPPDALATATEFTARAIKKALGFTTPAPNHIIVSGGGRKNSFLLSRIKANIPETTLVPSEELGFNGDMLEAQAFAYLAIRSVKNLPISFPTTTGCPHPLTGGVICRA
jgi:anhydro-N-acetylmuramic acid kinase